MLAQPLVSIFVLSYNNAKYIVETLDSIKAQTYPNIELVIIDDCSTDNSLEVINQWLANYDKPYKLVLHEKNKGICAACNSGLRNTTGEFISSIASDDVMMPGKIADQVVLLENSAENVAGVFSDAYLIQEDGSPRYGWQIQRCREFVTIPSGNIFDELLIGYFVPPMTILFKAIIFNEIGMYDENLIFEDYDMVLRIARKYEFIFSNYVSVKYRIRNNSLSNRIKNWNCEFLKIFYKHIDFSTKVIDKIEQICINSYINRDKTSISYIKKNEFKTAKMKTALLLYSLRFPPFIGRHILNKL